jgi:hypothetical protein
MQASLTTLAFAAACATFVQPLLAADKLAITASHALPSARPSETITIAWSEVNKALPGAMIQRIAVKDSAGRVLPHQVTNVAPLIKDPKKVGAAYGELIFQHSFAAGEQQASFTVEKIDTLVPVFAPKVSARYIQERLDDFAWENDKVAHRMYGPALGAPAPAGVTKEVLVSSGIDVWFKRVPYPIVDRWYNKGHDHYHVDQGEGMDMFGVGKSRGAGGTGIWHDGALHTSLNYRSWKVLANGPIRAIFELSYDGWDAGGTKVSEVKRFTVDAGHYLDQIDSTFTFAGPAKVTAAVGLGKAPWDKNQTAKTALSQTPADGTLVLWIDQSTNGGMGTAVVLPTATGFADDALNHLALAPATSGTPVRYLVGAAWSGAGEITSADAWKATVSAAALRFKNPLKVTASAVK